MKKRQAKALDVSVSKRPKKAAPEKAEKGPMDHFEKELDEQESTRMQAESLAKLPPIAVPGGKFHPVSKLAPSPPSANLGLDDLKPSIVANVSGAWSGDPIWDVVHSYTDLLHPNRPTDKEEVSRLTELLCAHVLNHALRTRTRVIANNERAERRKLSGSTEDEDDLRDQGLARPKTLILLPFRSSALRFVETLARLMFGGNTKEFVTNKKRFMDEFAVSDHEVSKEKPQDHKEMFAGNSDDAFRLGIAIAKKSLKLFADFYSADIIIASPLGLRMAVGAEGESTHEYDFLSSIQILILDQADVFLMQNWSHVTHILDHLHRQPAAAHGADFGRVRLWELNGLGRLYRQTISLSARPTPELRGLHARRCRNWAGSVELSPVFRPQGLLPAVQPGLVQLFQRFECPGGPEAEAEARFRFFLDGVLPAFLDAGLKHTAVFVPSYLDFVRLRNHFKRETLGSVQVSEYTKPGKISRARDLFFHGDKPFLLYSERAHFFKRHHIRGIHQLIFYQLPIFSEFYPELVDLVAESVEAAEEPIQGRITVLYSALDALRLAPVLGAQRAATLIKTAKPQHTIVASQS